MANPSPSPNLNPTPDTQQQPQTPPMNYRKCKWTVKETLTLITAKRLDDQRTNEESWKWIKNYCCAHGCFRSENQCKEKWDKLLCDYGSRNAGTESGTVSIREFNLPISMDFDIYKSLTAVLNLRNARQVPVSPTPVIKIPPLPPRPPPKDLSPPPAVMKAATQTEDLADELEESEELQQMKRRKVRDLGMTTEEKKQRHKELLELEERKLVLEERRLSLEKRRLSLEEERWELKKQAVFGLLSAFNGLSKRAHALVSAHSCHM